ncbi:hypothetical protein GCM10007159_39330 [Modicisalibacter luteus]|nr:hypothetical protein GCM10007159_39330 [Halomonas lutea]
MDFVSDQLASGRRFRVLNIVDEIIYTLSVAGSQAFTVLNWSISAIVFFLLTLYALSAALNTIDVGIGDEGAQVRHHTGPRAIQSLE